MIKLPRTGLYKKMSEWSLPNKPKVNLWTLNEEEHDFLMNEPGEEEQQPEENFDDVIFKILYCYKRNHTW